MSANQITKLIIKWLKLHKCYATRISTEGRVIGRNRVKSSVDKGTADIHACIAGTHHSIEIKYGKDKQSSEQKRVQEEVESAGGVYMIVREFDEFREYTLSEHPEIFK